MSIYKWVVRNSDGQFCLRSGPDPSIYLTDKVNYSLIDTGDLGINYPNERTQKWDGSRIVDKTQIEIAAYDTEQRDIIRAKEFSTLRGIHALAEATVELKTRAWTKAEFLQRVKDIYRKL